MNIQEQFRHVLLAEAQAITGIPLTHDVELAVAALLQCTGKVFTTGIGKAGYVAQKAASTLSTTGTPAIFLHPGDAPHGDVGAVRAGDVLIAFSNSGETREIVETAHFCQRLGAAPIIAVTSHRQSSLAKFASIILEIGTIVEPCPLGLTPTASTSAMIAVTDALALVVMKQRGFTHEDFALRHHGGYLGKKCRDEHL